MQDKLDFSVGVGKNEMTLKVKGKLSGDYALMQKAIELQSLFKKKAKEARNDNS